MQKNAQQYVTECDQCQRFIPIIKQLTQDLNSITSPWPFAQWGMDIVGPLPKALDNKRFLLVAMDYFIKWIKAEAFSKIRDVEVKRFVFNKKLTRFGIPQALIADNGTQFKSRAYNDFCSEYGIHNFYFTQAYPMSKMVKPRNLTELSLMESKEG